MASFLSSGGPVYWIYIFNFSSQPQKVEAISSEGTKHDSFL